MTPEAIHYARLVEECGEVLQAIGKIQRFGADNKAYTNSFGEQIEMPHTNREQLAKELGELAAVAKLMEVAGVIDHEIALTAYYAKFNKLAHYGKNEIPEGDGE